MLKKGDTLEITEGTELYKTVYTGIFTGEEFVNDDGKYVGVNVLRRRHSASAYKNGKIIESVWGKESPYFMFLKSDMITGVIYGGK